VISDFSPKGHKVYWVGAAGGAEDCGKELNFLQLAKIMFQ
jgi:hypothetical protein